MISSDKEALARYMVERGVLWCGNCGGQKCMACVCREMHDECEDDCPHCCLTPRDRIDVGLPSFHASLPQGWAKADAPPGNPAEEILRLRKALGEQTDLARRWKNRAHSAKAKRQRWQARHEAMESLARQLLDAYEIHYWGRIATAYDKELLAGARGVLRDDVVREDVGG